jgi:hypothetical protein
VASRYRVGVHTQLARAHVTEQGYEVMVAEGCLLDLNKELLTSAIGNYLCSSAYLGLLAALSLPILARRYINGHKLEWSVSPDIVQAVD